MQAAAAEDAAAAAKGATERIDHAGILVEVVEAVDLPAMDMCGLSDPFLTITLGTSSPPIISPHNLSSWMPLVHIYLYGAPNMGGIDSTGYRYREVGAHGHGAEVAGAEVGGGLCNGVLRRPRPRYASAAVFSFFSFFLLFSFFVLLCASFALCFLC